MALCASGCLLPVFLLQAYREMADTVAPYITDTVYQISQWAGAHPAIRSEGGGGLFSRHGPFWRCVTRACQLAQNAGPRDP